MATAKIINLAKYREAREATSGPAADHNPPRAVTEGELQYVQVEVERFCGDLGSRERPRARGLVEDGIPGCPINTLSLLTGLPVSRLALVVQDAQEWGLLKTESRLTDWGPQLCILPAHLGRWS